MRTVYLGTSEFAAAVLRRLAGSPHRPVLVVTPPDRPRGRGRKLAAAAGGRGRRASSGIELHQTAERQRPGVAWTRIRAAGAEVGVVCAFGQLIREPLLSELEMLNVHPSLLPRWRGAAPIERAIMAGDARDRGHDHARRPPGSTPGPVALQRADADRARATTSARSPARLAELGGELLVRALDLRAAGAARARRAGRRRGDLRGEDRPRRAPARPRAAGGRAGAHGPGADPAHRRLPGARRRRAARRARRARPRTASSRPARLRGRGRALLLGCGEGALRLEVVQPAGGRPMEADAYLRGHPLPARELSGVIAAARPSPAPALRAYEVLRATFEQDAFTERAFRGRRRAPRPRRPRARPGAAARLRRGPAPRHHRRS